MSKSAAFFVLLVSLTVTFQLAHSLRITKWIDDAAAKGACNDTQDLTAFVKYNSTFHGDLKSCASSCLGASDCSAKCIAGKVGLTTACAACFGADVGCTAVNCPFACLSPDSPACVACSIQYCEPALLACAGVQKSALPGQ